jgi:putative restriction endonuclease
MKIGNFGSFDPRLQALGIVGLTGVSKLDEQVWQTYYGNWDKLAIDAAKITADLMADTLKTCSSTSFFIE